ncbi:G-type lectin S-receptor-like serine/threonine-protein kinase At4g27290 [Coffea arabica]|uniref:Receptor-like serine/threonine-protein kinase n=1 Tax=Coffea arabica TaxID=13443 RepID=A0ABM4VKK5_COFAR
MDKECKYSQCLLLLLFACKFCLSKGVDTLSRGQSLSGNETIVSKDGTFELGFFATGRSNNVYLGIWYSSLAPKTIVWVANRVEPIFNTSQTSRLEISKDGNLVLLDHSGSIAWSTNLVSAPASSVEAVLLDNGNFVLRETSNASNLFWQSFDYPTDTWLPGAKLGYKMLSSNNSYEVQRLVSWRSTDDPAPGMFSLVLDTNTSGSEILIQWNKSVSYWNSGIWNGSMFPSAPELKYLINLTFVSDQSETYYTYSAFESAVVLWRFVMDTSGQLKLLQATRGLGYGASALTFTQPIDQSDVYAFCGEFGVFTGNYSSSCTCLEGFESTNDGVPGCARKTPQRCKTSTSPERGNAGFLPISNMTLPGNPQSLLVENADGCKSACQENCSCTAYSYGGSGCLIWIGALLDLKQAVDVKKKLHLKVASSEIQVPPTVSGNKDNSGDKKRSSIIVAVVVPLAAAILGGFIIFVTWKIKQRGGRKKESSEDLLSYDFDSSNSETDSETKNANDVRQGKKGGLILPFFSYASVCTATNNFSAGNKIGEGGFGPVYKGKSLKGQEIAVKRLSRGSGQGLKEFRNEALLIAKLQHRNLVRLLGCCNEQEESILIYEYMSNKSLDSFIFDPVKQMQIDWDTRISIVQGIAQGILYLHEYSRLRIVHRDLKASNILLDSEMNPKISDFGTARIFGGSDSKTNTKRIVGTPGYMAPEYLLEGLFSAKSDVYSFGVLVLEIVSGRKNTGFHNSDSLHLLGHAWELWNSKRALELIDPSLGCPPDVAPLRCINIGLLCIEENPNDRPAMSDVVSMLGNELAALPSPKQPAFTAIRPVINTKSISSNDQKFSVNGLTISSVEPR